MAGARPALAETKLVAGLAMYMMFVPLLLALTKPAGEDRELMAVD